MLKMLKTSPLNMPLWLIPMLYVVVMKVTGGSKRVVPPSGGPPPVLATEHGQGGH